MEVTKEVKTSKTRRFARTKRTKRARCRPTNERRAYERANDAKETDERTKKKKKRKKKKRGGYIITNKGRPDTVHPLFSFFFAHYES